MIVTFIYPAVGNKTNEKYISSWKMRPLPIMTLAALTPEDIEVKFFDDRLEAIDYEHATDLVAINIEAYSALRAYSIAEKFAARGIPVIFGGYHATLMPDEVNEKGFSVLVGEAETIWGDVISDVKQKKIKKRYTASSHPKFGYIFPRNDIIQGKKYTPLTLIETSRGCVFACNFCSISQFFRQNYSVRTIDSIIKEIEYNKSKHVFFVDDNIVADPVRAKALFKALIPLKIKWMGQFSLNMANDDELLKVMKASGCIGVLIGFESMKVENLKSMGKAWNANVDYALPLKKLRDNGLCIYGTFLFGYDHDDAESFELTYEFAKKHNFFFTAFNHLQPFPGTKHYETLEREGRLIYSKWWLDPNYQYGKIVFNPKLMSADELETKCIEYRSKFYSYSSIFKRALDFKTNSSSLFLTGVFLTQNILARKEVYEKWGLPLAQNLDTQYK